MNNEKKEKKRLLESQKQLIILKNQMIQKAQNEYQYALNVIADELGIDIEKEIWQLDEKVEYFMFLRKKEPDLKFPQGRKKGRQQ